MPTAIVAGVLAGKPGNGGNAWSRLSLVEGLRRLGLDVIFIEQLADPTPQATAYFEAIRNEFGLDGHLLTGDPAPDLVERAHAASLLINVGGHLTLDCLKDAARVRVYLDDDPGYTQLWQSQGLLGDRLSGHDQYFTFGENIGRPECPLPAAGVDWIAMKPPVVLADWPVTAEGGEGFTTVGAWRGGYGRVEWNGRLMGQKAHEFRKFADLPRQTAHPFEIALDIDPADSQDRELMDRNGWRIVDPREAAGSPDAFRRYVQGSGAEFSVAQGIYVETACGWFSDRTTRYLASGKPALVQDTGFSRNLPAGEGLIAFATMEQAVAGANAIWRDYRHHSQAARALAEEHFDSDRVLGRLLERAGL